MIKPVLQTLKGFRDFLPAEKRKRDFVAKKVVEIFELFGFEPLETPTLEYASLLLGKYGQEADKLLYKFTDKGDREIALRYDQTVPTARILAQYQNILPKYFRRYQIQNVFRADKPQQGRYREFTQCDIDIFGSTSPLADAEILACTYFAYKNVGYPEIILQINDRQTLFNTLKSLKTFTMTQSQIFSIIQSVDKLEKLGKEGVVKELVKDKGFPLKTVELALNALKNAEISNNLKEVIRMTEKLGVPTQSIKFTPTMARGLDYYTGMIFEVILPGYPSGSVGGGGRYDKLIEQLGGLSVPAVGIAFGFDRMVEAADSFNIISSKNDGAQVLVTIFDETQLTSSLTIAQKLRENKIATEVYPAFDKLDKQLKYADKKDISYVVIIGPEEAKKDVLKLKNMKTGEQKVLSVDSLIKDILAT